MEMIFPPLAACDKPARSPDNTTTKDAIMQRGIEPRRRTKSIPPPASVDLTSTALLLDVDGTLLDIASTPDGVVVPASLNATLERLLAQTGGTVALVSGRTIPMLDRLFQPLKLPAIGGHGAEMRLAPEGAVIKQHPPGLSEAIRKRLHALAEIDPRLLVEDKQHSIAVHYRLALQQEPLLEKEIAAIIADEPGDEIEVLPGKAVIEIKPSRFNKGVAVRTLMGLAPFLGRKPIFIGDDTTDEAVFAILPGLRGVGFSVGRAMPGADGVIPSPEHVRTWLAHLATSAEPAP
jgi:trehalose 6-phosphate phosphatase